MKYDVYTFNEVISGHIEIEADQRPDSDEIIKNIQDGRLITIIRNTWISSWSK